MPTILCNGDFTVNTAEHMEGPKATVRSRKIPLATSEAQARSEG